MSYVSLFFIVCHVKVTKKLIYILKFMNICRMDVREGHVSDTVIYPQNKVFMFHRSDMIL